MRHPTPPMNTIAVPPELMNEWPDATRLQRQIFDLYVTETGQVLNSPPTDADMRAVVTWLQKNASALLSHYLKSRAALVPAFSPTLSFKVSHLAQFHCPICATKDGLYPVQVVSIRIRPVSKQAIGQKPKRRAAFERAIRHRFRDHKTRFNPSLSICLLIVFVVKGNGVQKDLDNMAKAIVDAVKTVLFGDDRRIDHLNIIRINSPDEEFVYLNIRPTTLNRHDDVLFPQMLHSWAGAEALDIEDFINRSD